MAEPTRAKTIRRKPGGVTQSGSGKLFPYASPTTLVAAKQRQLLGVTDIETTVTELKVKGVVFGTGMPSALREGDIHIMGGMRTALV